MQQTNQPPQLEVLPAPEPFLAIEHVSKVYPTRQGPYSVLQDINLAIAEGEFVCFIGHSGCGKSTLLNMVAGFHLPTDGSIRLRSQPIKEPGPDRMVVFQNYALLPWCSVFDNVYLAVNAVHPRKAEAEKRAIVRDHLAMVGLNEAMHKKPGQIS
ncbi:MAG: ATP-binding cassette domain-containing protein, partial [Phormidesmis sp. RL_2_1]|nr:ATP-binding cassette domain-containing protein [Phormidesmis sp. RL_2_1]